jgi:hypothetical protein
MGRMGMMLSLGLVSGRWCPVAIGIVDVIVEFGEGFVGDGGEEFFERGLAQFDVRGFWYGVAGPEFGFCFFGFAASHEFSGEANLGDVFVEIVVVRAEKVEVLFLDFAPFLAGDAAPFVFNSVGDVWAFDPFAEFEFFLFGGVGLGECEPVALDLEVIVGEGGTAEAGDVVGELAEGVPFAVGVGFGVDVAGHGGVLELGPEEEFGGET